MIDSIEGNMIIRANKQKYGHLWEALDYTVLELEPSQGREYIKEFLVSQRERYSWEVQGGGISTQEERLLDAYDYALSLPIEQRKGRYRKIGTHIVQREGKVPKLDKAEEWFIGSLHGALGKRPEEIEAGKQEILDMIRRDGGEVDKNPTPEQKAMTEEGKRRREEREQTKRNWREIREERNAERDDRDQINR